MEIREENSTDITQEKQNYINTHTNKDLFEESQIPNTNILNANLKELYDYFSELTQAINDGNEQYVSNYFECYSECIKKATYDANEPYEYIEFILPYINALMQVNTCENVLKYVMKSVYSIVLNSHYYCFKITNSSLIQQLLTIIRENISDFITGVGINIIYRFSLHDELHDIAISMFPTQLLFEYLASKYYQNNVKDGLVQLIYIHLSHTTDDQKLYEIFSSILQYLVESKSIDVIVLDLISLIGRFYYKNEEKGIYILPEGIREFVSRNFFEIVKNADKAIEDEIFYLIYYFSINGVEINYPVEEIYQYVLYVEKDSEKIEKLIVTLANAINVRDDIEFTKLFITNSLKDVINYAFEKGSTKCKQVSLILLASVLVTDNYELFLSILYSPAFTNFLYFIENNYDDQNVIFGVGILGNALHFLKTTMPNGEEIKYFLSALMSCNLPEQFAQISERSNLMAELLNDFCFLVESEISRLSSG